MKVIPLKRISRPYKNFKNREWKLIHPELYGEKLNWDYWNPKALILKAVELNRVVGALSGELVAGVLYINEVIVEHNLRQKGIGEALMKEAEEWAKKNKAHEVYLVVGKKWKAVLFYKKLGYETSTLLPKHYSKIDFLLMRKFLD